MSWQRGGGQVWFAGAVLSVTVACLVGGALGAGAGLHGGRAADGASSRSGPPQASAAAPHLSWGAYLPIALRGDFVTGVRPIDPATATPTEPTPEPTATPTEPPPASGVLFQIATYGGLSMDLMLYHMPSMTPWFTLYADGTYIRTYRHRQEPYELERRTGRLDQTALEAFERKMLDDIEFFDLPASPPQMVCVTDQPYDRVHLSVDGRRHDMVVYGLSFYGDGEYRCPEPPDRRLVALAGFVALLNEPLVDSEQPYEVERGTLVATEVEPWATTPPTWPISLTRLADLPATSPRALHLQDEQARGAVATVDAADRYRTGVAYFQEDQVFWLVGFRVEFDGWDSYGPSFFPQWITRIVPTVSCGDARARHGCGATYSTSRAAPVPDAYATFFKSLPQTCRRPTTPTRS